MSRQQRRAQQREFARQAANVNRPATGGPQTPQGKAISSQNATSHGLTAARLVLPWENKAEFDRLLTDLVSEHRPATVTEHILVRELAEQYWRLQRARNREYQLLAFAGSAPQVDDERNILLAQRYATRFERAFHKCLSTLRTLQKERRQREAEAQTEAEASQPAQPAQPAAEFVSKNAQVEPSEDFAYTTAAAGHTVAALDLC